MAKIDNYKKIRAVNTEAIQNLNRVMRLTSDGSKCDPHNDKGRMAFHDHETWGSDMPVYIHASYGYYGSSDGYTASSENLRGYIIKVLNSMTNEIIGKAQELLALDIELARKAAKDEALEVLKQTGETNA